MSKKATVKSVETLSCDAGWRNYHFVKVVTDDGIVGWSEYDEGFGAPGVTAAIERLSTDANVSVKQLAADLGYASVPAFSHAFRQITGKTPTQFSDAK